MGAHCATYFIHRWLLPMQTKKLDEKTYVAGDKISVADIMAVCELDQPSMAGYVVSKDRKVLADYLQRVRQDLNPHYNEVSDIVFKMRDKFGGNIPGVTIPAK